MLLKLRMWDSDGIRCHQTHLIGLWTKVCISQLWRRWRKLTHRNSLSSKKNEALHLPSNNSQIYLIITTLTFFMWLLITGNTVYLILFTFLTVFIGECPGRCSGHGDCKKNTCQWVWRCNLSLSLSFSVVPFKLVNFSTKEDSCQHLIFYQIFLPQEHLEIISLFPQLWFWL